MCSCHLVLVLIGTTLHGAQALDRRPAIAMRPSSRSHDILRGGAGNKPHTATAGPGKEALTAAAALLGHLLLFAAVLLRLMARKHGPGVVAPACAPPNASY